ncbi:MAG: replication-associated recombination protein A [Chlamydiae bacterium]|nr:MAG: replication-associated recombination protein A [Chlamydiota bacterium]
MRPQRLEEIVGQKHLLASGSLLDRAIRSDTLTSAIFYGPPGCGKTTLAEVIAKTTKRYFRRLSAVSASVKDVREAVSLSTKLQNAGQHGLVLFLDEIHRFSKSQQDVLLPCVEDGTIVLIGATTENPFFALNAALLSRSRIFQFESIEEEEIIVLLKRALKDKTRGLGKFDANADDNAMAFFAMGCDGDARVALVALELAVTSAPKSANGKIHITLADAEASLQKKNIVYDKAGDSHYDTISAFIKAMRGSDPDAALYWLAKMIEAGEDPRFIARRMVIFASEDIGCADPLALSQAIACFQAVERVGLPEARINLGHVVAYLACSPKSNATYTALNKATEDVQSGRTLEIPRHLRTQHKGAKELGHTGYKYSHNYDGHYVAQDYLPAPRRYYEPTNEGWEAKIADRLERWRAQKQDKKKSNSAKF